MLTFDTLKINTAGSVMNIFESVVFGKLVFRQLLSLLGYVTRGGPGLFGLRHSWIHSASHISWTNPDEWHFLIKPVAVFWLPFWPALFYRFPSSGNSVQIHAILTGFFRHLLIFESPTEIHFALPDFLYEQPERFRACNVLSLKFSTKSEACQGWLLSHIPHKFSIKWQWR